MTNDLDIRAAQGPPPNLLEEMQARALRERILDPLVSRREVPAASCECGHAKGDHRGGAIGPQFERLSCRECACAKYQPVRQEPLGETGPVARQCCRMIPAVVDVKDGIGQTKQVTLHRLRADAGPPPMQRCPNPADVQAHFLFPSRIHGVRADTAAMPIYCCKPCARAHGFAVGPLLNDEAWRHIVAGYEAQGRIPPERNRVGLEWRRIES